MLIDPLLSTVKARAAKDESNTANTVTHIHTHRSRFYAGEVKEKVLARYYFTQYIQSKKSIQK